jgi:hypothetical protein
MAMSIAEKRAQSAAWAKRNRSKMNEYSRQHWRRRRQKALEAYGGKCRCCGEDRYEFLAIDHVNGSGIKHRQRVGISMALLLKKEGYPQDGRYQVLCHNCNLAKGFYGRCPHQELAREEFIA